MRAIFIALTALPQIFVLLAWATAPASRPEVAYGTPTPVEAEHPGYVRGHCGHYPEWVAEHLTAENLQGNAPRAGNDFTEDPDVPLEFRPRLKDYKGSGYDRGHLANAANHHGDPMQMRATFLLSNMMPQTKQLNERKAAWEGLEEHLRGIAETQAEVWVFTGPAFLPDDSGEIRIKTLGDGRIFVPTHCWKTVLIKRGEVLSMRSYLMPNVEDPPAWEDCVVSCDTIEAATGLNFWDALPDEVEDELEKAE